MVRSGGWASSASAIRPRLRDARGGDTENATRSRGDAISPTTLTALPVPSMTVPPGRTCRLLPRSATGSSAGPARRRILCDAPVPASWVEKPAPVDDGQVLTSAYSGPASRRRRAGRRQRSRVLFSGGSMTWASTQQRHQASNTTSRAGRLIHRRYWRGAFRRFAVSGASRNPGSATAVFVVVVGEIRPDRASLSLDVGKRISGRAGGTTGACVAASVCSIIPKRLRFALAGRFGDRRTRHDAAVCAPVFVITWVRHDQVGDVVEHAGQRTPFFGAARRHMASKSRDELRPRCISHADRGAVGLGQIDRPLEVLVALPGSAVLELLWSDAWIGISWVNELGVRQIRRDSCRRRRGEQQAEA